MRKVASRLHCCVTVHHWCATHGATLLIALLGVHITLVRLHVTLLGVPHELLFVTLLLMYCTIAPTSAQSQLVTSHALCTNCVPCLMIAHALGIDVAGSMEGRTVNYTSTTIPLLFKPCSGPSSTSLGYDKSCSLRAQLCSSQSQREAANY